MIRSLRARLFIWLTTIIIVTGALSAVLVYKWAFGEAMELQDSVLIQLASLAQNGSVSGGQPLQGVEEDTEVWLIELGKVTRDPTDDRQLFGLKDGLHIATRKSQPIRVLLRTRSDGSRFAVAQPTSVRDDTAREMAVRTLLPIAALIPCLMLVTALVIAYSLRPVVRLADDLDARRADDLTPLLSATTPSELQPFISSINGLLARIGLLMDQQRRFVADAAHELRTPITALSLQAENLEAVDLPDLARDRVAALGQGMRRTKHLLEQLLALARSEAATAHLREMPLTALDGIAKEVLADLLPYALERGVDLGFQLLEPITIRAEPVMFATLLRNLVENALRVTPEGGQVDIGVYQQDGLAALQIEDTGPGIAPPDLERVFEPFFRGSSPEGDGSGLGLSIVERAVQRLGGTIALENITGSNRSGLRVTVRLPLDH
jgi:two-component system OmpR family sensor kinase